MSMRSHLTNPAKWPIPSPSRWSVRGVEETGMGAQVPKNVLPSIVGTSKEQGGGSEGKKET